VGQIILWAKGDQIGGEADGYIVLFQQQNTKNNEVVTQCGDEHWEFLVVFLAAKVPFSNVGDVPEEIFRPSITSRVWGVLSPGEVSSGGWQSSSQ
jgi:hypothetical protein